MLADMSDVPHRSSVPVRAPVLVLRATAAAFAVLAILQTALAGSFLSGHYDALKLHRFTAMAMVLVALVQAVVAVLARRSGAPRQVLALALLLPVLLAAEAVLGALRVLGLHVPVGVLLVVGAVRLTGLVWQAPRREAAASA